jgi:uncharacterized protein (DUF1501 family)
MGHFKKNNAGLRPGDSLSGGTAHSADHGRRSFLRNLGIIGTSGFLLNNLPVAAAGMSPLAAALAASGDDERVLVMIRLKGGNDGLNTLIPIHDFGTYEQVRPDIHIPRDEVVEFTSTLGVHPQLAPLQGLWNGGAMRVVQNVGYPNPNLSHFRSSDIWASSATEEVETSGVFGRYLNDLYPDFLSNPPVTPPAIQIGGPGNLLFNNQDDFNYAISTENPTQLYNIARNGQLHDVEAVPDCTYGEQLGYIRAVANTTFRYAGVLASAFEAGENTAEYANDRLGDQLALVARLLRGGLGTRLFVVELDGFDTHASQPINHARLMDSLGTNVKAFFEDLSAGDIDDRVMAMTFSEFGRRIFQNGSMGTDHGAAAPMMLFGGGLNGNGMTGGLPDMTDVDGSFNMKHTVDFREVYATVLSNWLCIDGGLVDELLGANYERIDDLGLFCQGTTSSHNPRAERIGMRAFVSGGDVVVEYDLPATANVGIHFFDVGGRKLNSPFRGRRGAGTNLHRFGLNSFGHAAGVYVVSLEVNGKMYSRKIGLFR